MKNHEQKKKKVKKVENQDSMGKTNFFFNTLPFSPLGSFSHMAACRSSSKDIGKMSLILVFNKKIHHGLIWSQNWTCLVFTESL
jgi:hypothetical protein